MSTKIIGNQIDATTRAIMEALQITEQLNLPNLNQTQVTALGTPAYGTVVYNSTEDAAQIYKQDANKVFQVGQRLEVVVLQLVTTQLSGLTVQSLKRI